MLRGVKLSADLAVALEVPRETTKTAIARAMLQCAGRWELALDDDRLTDDAISGLVALAELLSDALDEGRVSVVDRATWAARELLRDALPFQPFALLALLAPSTNVPMMTVGKLDDWSRRQAHGPVSQVAATVLRHWVETGCLEDLDGRGRTVDGERAVRDWGRRGA